MSSMIYVIFIITGVIVAAGFIFVIASIFSPKLRAKMMGKQIKATKYVMDEHEDDLTDIATTAANITKEGIETTTRAIKKGITEEETIYCKHCGEAIDNDSSFCKKCGKHQ